MNILFLLNNKQSLERLHELYFAENFALTDTTIINVSDCTIPTDLKKVTKNIYNIHSSIGIIKLLRLAFALYRFRGYNRRRSSSIILVSSRYDNLISRLSNFISKPKKYILIDDGVMVLSINHIRRIDQYERPIERYRNYMMLYNRNSSFFAYLKSSLKCIFYSAIPSPKSVIFYTQFQFKSANHLDVIFHLNAETRSGERSPVVTHEAHFISQPLITYRVISERDFKIILKSVIEKFPHAFYFSHPKESKRETSIAAGVFPRGRIIRLDVTYESHIKSRLCFPSQIISCYSTVLFVMAKITKSTSYTYVHIPNSRIITSSHVWQINEAYSNLESLGKDISRMSVFDD